MDLDPTKDGTNYNNLSFKETGPEVYNISKTEVMSYGFENRCVRVIRLLGTS